MSLDKANLDTLKIQRNDSPSGGRNLKGWIVAGVILVVVLVFGGKYLADNNSKTVKFLTIRASGAGGINTVLNASGYVTARRQATVSSKMTGKVVEVLLEEGMKVESGQVLARLDDSNTRVNLDLAEAQLLSAKAALEEIKVRIEEADSDLKRVETLAKNNFASLSDQDHARAEAASLKARLQRQQVEVLVAERQLALWKQQMDDTIIRAPFSGVVVTKNAQPGEMISPVSAGGGFTRTGIGTVVDMASLEIEVDVNESVINRVHAAQPVDATLDSYPGFNIPAKVIAIIPTADRQKATVKVRIGFNQLDPRILPDMGVKVAFHETETGSNVVSKVVIPKTALFREENQDYVWIEKKGKSLRHPITTGPASGNDVPVLTGLASGEKVVIDIPKGLKEGDPIKELP